MSRASIREVRELADSMGWQVTSTRNGHLKLTKPGRPMVFTASTTSDRRAIKNLRARLRRAERGDPT